MSEREVSFTAIRRSALSGRAGAFHEEIMRGYHVEREDIDAALRYAAELARERIVPFVAGAA